MDAKDQKFDVATMFSSDWIINGTEVEEELGDYMHERLGFELSNPQNSLCPHCRGRFRCRNFDDTIDGNDEWHNDRTYIVKFCTKCVHWEFLGSEGGNKCMDPQSNVILFARCCCDQESAVSEKGGLVAALGMAIENRKPFVCGGGVGYD